MNTLKFKHELFNAVFEDIYGYEDLYRISKNGEIWSCHYNKIMTSTLDTRNNRTYAKIILTNTGITYHFSIHRLLAMQYIPNLENKLEVDHIDRNTLNNSISNLRWATHSENMNNKQQSKCNLTEREIKEKDEETRLKHNEYARMYQSKKRRLQGCKIRSEMTLTKDPHYCANKFAKKTEEEKEVIREKWRNDYHKDGKGLAYQQEYLAIPENKEHRKQYEQEKRNNMTEKEREKINARARGYYYEDHENQKEKAKLRARAKAVIKASLKPVIAELTEQEKLEKIQAKKDYKANWAREKKAKIALSLIQQA